MKRIQGIFFLGAVWVLAGCLGPPVKGDPAVTLGLEPGWIREGHPIEFEGEFWYPVDDVESFLDSEMYLVGRFEKTDFFVDRVDIKPYKHLYTKFGRNKYRMFDKDKPSADSESLREKNYD